MASEPPSDGRRSRHGASGRATASPTAQMVRLPFADVTSRNIRLLAAYWEELRDGRRFPRKRGLDPGRMKPLLPYLILAEYQYSPLRIRYRLVGTEQARFIGMDYTGKWLDEIGWQSDYVNVWLRHVAEMVETGLPIFGRDTIVWTDDKLKEYEWAVFPLSEDGATVTHGIGIEDFSTIERRSGILPLS